MSRESNPLLEKEVGCMEGSGAILVTARNRFSSSLVQQPRVQGRSKCSGGRIVDDLLYQIHGLVIETARACAALLQTSAHMVANMSPRRFGIYQMGKFSPWDRHSFCPMTVAAAVAGYYHSSDSISILPGTAPSRSCIMHHSSPESSLVQTQCLRFGTTCAYGVGHDFHNFHLLASSIPSASVPTLASIA